MNSYFWGYICSLRVTGGKLKLFPIHPSKVVLIMNPAIKLSFSLRGATPLQIFFAVVIVKAWGHCEWQELLNWTGTWCSQQMLGSANPWKAELAGPSLQELRALCSDRQRQGQDTIFKLQNTESAQTWWELPRKAVCVSHRETSQQDDSLLGAPVSGLADFLPPWSVPHANTHSMVTH